jgi:hypothetical protein
MRWAEFGLNRSVVAGVLWRRRREFARYGLLGAVSRCESHTTRGWSQASAFAWHRYLQRRRRSRAEMTQRAAPSKWTGRAHMFGIAAVDRDIMRVTHGHRRTISVVAERLTLCRRSVSAESARLRRTYVGESADALGRSNELDSSSSVKNCARPFPNQRRLSAVRPVPGCASLSRSSQAPWFGVCCPTSRHQLRAIEGIVLVMGC